MAGFRSSSSVFHLANPGSIPGQSMYVCGGESGKERGFPPVRLLRFSPVCTIPSVSQAHLHLHTVVVRWTSRPCSGAFQKAMLFGKSGKIGYKINFTFLCGEIIGTCYERDTDTHMTQTHTGQRHIQDTHTHDTDTHKSHYEAKGRLCLHCSRW